MRIGEVIVGSGYQVEERTLAEQPTAVMRGRMRVDAIGAFLARTYAAVATYVQRMGGELAGAPLARYRQDGEEFEVEAGFPLVAAVEAGDEVQAGSLPGGPAAVTWHVGPYDAMAPAYDAIADWIARQGGEAAGPPWEVYYSDPQEHPDPATWRTEVVQPIRRP